MSERVRVQSKTHDTKKDNSISQTQLRHSTQHQQEPIDQVFFLQQTLGNQSVQRFFKGGVFKAKPNVSQPNDKYEQEADRISDQADHGLIRVLHKTESCSRLKNEFNKETGNTIQRQFVTPLGPGGGYGGLMDRDRRRTLLRGRPITRTFALTFDDGPHTAELGTGQNRTENVLDTLKTNNIKAGFFVQTGLSYRGANPIGIRLIRRMANEGHKIGIHTGGAAGHELHTTAQEAGRLEGELEAAKEYISETTKTEDQTGQTPEFVRPPEGKYNKDVLETYKKVNLTNLMWDIDGDQGKNLNLTALKSRIEIGVSDMIKRKWKKKTPSPHIIILYHDIQKGTSENLDSIINHFKESTSVLSDGDSQAEFKAP